MTPVLGLMKPARDLKKMCKEKGVDPWIEIDGGASGKNAKEIKEAGDGCSVLGWGGCRDHSIRPKIFGGMKFDAKIYNYYIILMDLP